jgi:CubicO group peptidase (beta-lactamase class C family)
MCNKFRLFIFLLLLFNRSFSQKPILLPPDTLIQSWLTENHVPAVGIGIIDKGKVKSIKVLGELKSGIKAAPNSMFSIASLTKPIVEMTTLRLVSKGLWNLDEPIYPYWVDPEVSQDPRHKLLTTRHIITHQTGFVNWRWLHSTGKLTFDFDPGTRTQYSGEGLEYLKKALESKFKKTLEAIVKEELFIPEQMKDTRFYWDSGMNESLYAVQHNKEGQPYQIRKNKEASAADLLMTTVVDYTRFGASVINKNKIADWVWNEMIKRQAPEQNSKFGLGWEVYPGLPNEEFALIHSGSDPGVRTVIILLPVSQRGIIIFTNGDNGTQLILKLITSSLDIGEELIKMSK